MSDTEKSIEWSRAPIRSQWGAEMVNATVELDHNHTLDLYAEREAIHLVEPALRKLLSSDRAKLTAIVQWLEANQPDVFKRGLWDAINGAT